MTSAVPGKVDWRTTVAYGTGAIASAAKTAPITSFLMLYYNQVVGLSALSVATVLMITLIFDAMFDPVVGQVSDNFRSRWGRRLPFMYASALPLTALFIALWIPPRGWTELALATYLGACLIGVRFFDTFFELPHLALIPEMTSDYHERTRLFTVRYLFEAASGVGVSALAYNVFMKEKPDGTGGLLSADGYPAFACVTGAFILVTILACTRGLHRRLPLPVLPAAPRVPVRTHLRQIAATLNSRSLAVLASTAVFISIGSGIGSSLNMYGIIYFYQFTQAQMTALAMLIMLSMGLTAFTPAISSGLGKRNAAILLCWLYVASAAIPLMARLLDFLPPKSPLLLVLVGAQTVMGAASMTMLLITLSSMMSDLVEEAEVRTGRRSEGLLLSANSLVRKATQGLGTFGAGVILTAVAFPRGLERNQVPESVLNDMALLYLGTKIVLFACATATLLFYRDDRATYEAHLRTLATKPRDPGH